ncbi:MAG: hypothetical protein JEZ07_19475 [Phycisphaerae bacterium]|nr:hypothetical protein [Phycisphaerae bacterium]
MIFRKLVILSVAIMMVSGFAYANPGDDESNIFTIDNREKELTISSEYCQPDKDKVYFIIGPSLQQEFTAKLVWPGCTEGIVDWYVNGQIVYQDLFNKEPLEVVELKRTFNVGTDFVAGGTIFVNALGKVKENWEKFQEEPKKANFEVILQPEVFLEKNIFSFVHSKAMYETSSFGIGLPALRNEPISPSNNQLSKLADCEWLSVVEASASIDLKGKCEIKAKTGLVEKELFNISRAKFTPSLALLMTMDYTRSGWLYGGGFELGLSGTVPTPPNYVVFLVGPVPVPVYYNFIVSAQVAAKCLLKGGDIDGGLVFTGSIPVDGSLEALAGVGFSGVISADGYLKGGLYLNFDVYPVGQLESWNLALDGGIRLYAFIYSYENNLLHFQYPGARSSALYAADGMKNSKMIPMTRDYLNGDYAIWNGGKKTKALGSGEVLQANVFGQSNPVIAVSGNSKCLVWLYDDPTRNSLDRTKLVYSINNGSGWSVPVAIDDDGTADASPSLAVDSNGDFVCVWANASQLIADGTSLAGFADKLDIKMAVYNSGSGTWSSETVTSSAGLDYNPKVAADNTGNIHIVWTHDDNNDMLAESGAVVNKLMLRTKSSAGWDTEQQLNTFSGLVQYTDIETDTNGTHIVVSVDTDSDFQTDNDNELFYVNNMSGSWSLATQLTSDLVADNNPQLVKTSSNLMLIWAREGKIVSTTDISGMTNIIEAVAKEGSSGQRGFIAAVSPTDNISVVWNDPSEAGSDMYTATYDPAMNFWSAVVQMSNDRNMERSITAAYSAGDTLELAYNKVQINSGDGLNVFGQVDLCANTYTIASDLTVLADGITLGDPEAMPGDTVLLQVEIENIGDVAVKDIPVAFYLGTTANSANQIGTTQICAGDLPAGEKKTVSVNWTIPTSNEAANVLVVIDPEVQIEDKNRDNNTAVKSFFGPDLSVESVEIAKVDNKYVISAVVANIGHAAVSGEFTVNISDYDNAVVLASQSVSSLAQGDSAVVSFTVLPKKIVYGMSQLRVTVDSGNVVAEDSEDNNLKYVLVNNARETDIVIDGIIDIADLGMLAQQWLSDAGSLSADIAPEEGDGKVDINDFARMSVDWLLDADFVPGYSDSFETGDFTGLNWQLSGNANWTIDTTGNYSAKSGVITHSQNSELSLTVDCTGCQTVSFARKISSESGYDYLTFYIDGVQKQNWSGSGDWLVVSYPITDGQHTFKWSYTKDSSVSSGSDCAWIDDVVIE